MRTRLLFLLLALTPATPLWAQGEIEGFGGLSRLTSPGIRGVFGARGGVWAGTHLQLFGEYSRLPLSRSTYLTNTPAGFVQLKISRRYDVIGGGLQARFLSTRKIQPFLVFPFVGLARYTLSGNPTGNSVMNDLAVGIGGGVRLYCGDNWGFQPEYRGEAIIDPTDLLGRSYAGHILTAGLFYQFGGR